MIDVASAVARRGPDVASAVVRRGPVRSDVHRARGAGPLRLLCPRSAGDAAWIVTSSLGGGLVDGDDVQLDLDVDAGATCVVTTQASTKVYKGASRQRLHARVREGGTLLLVPDAVVPYRDAAFTQVTKLELATDATLVVCDVVTAGRVAYGERWNAARIDTTLSIAIDGRLCLHDRMLIEGARMGRFDALGTIVLLGPRVRDIAAAQLASLDGLAAGSPLRGGAIVRIAGSSSEAVVRATRAWLEPACAVLGEQPWSRKW